MGERASGRICEWVLLRLLCYLLFAICYSGSAATAGKPITLQLDWKANAQFAGPLVAKEAGWYREAGLDVTSRPADEHTDPVAEVVNHPGWIGVCEADVLLFARTTGQPLRESATLFHSTRL